MSGWGWSSWAAVVAVLVAVGPGPRRPVRLPHRPEVGLGCGSRPVVASPVDPGIEAWPRLRRVWSRGAEGVGRSVGRCVGLELDRAGDRRLGQALLAAGAAGLAHPFLVAPLGVLAWVGPPLRERALQRRRAARVLAETPDLVELFRLAVGAGLTVHLAVAAVAPRARGLTGAALSRVPARVALGECLGDALAQVSACGDAVAPLVAALVASERDGVALGPSLERVAGQARLARRRHAEEAARRLPVLLVFPLVLCILPAFVLLTVVPLLLGLLPKLVT